MLCGYRTVVLRSRILLRVRNYSVSQFRPMDLKQVVSRLENFAPLSLAETWDNVGLLVEPSGKHTVKTLLLTNDLTENVLQEAIEKNVQMLISYHPPIFVPLKRLTSRNFKERIIIKAVEERIAIYSPHTAFDAVSGGVNDWLASGLGSGTVIPLHNSLEDYVKGSTCSVIATVAMDTEDNGKIEQDIGCLDGVCAIDIAQFTKSDSSTAYKVEVTCSESSLSHVMQSLQTYQITKMDVYPLTKVPIPRTGTGRLFTLDVPVSLSDLISSVKHHLCLHHVRLALAGRDAKTGGSVSSIKEPNTSITTGTASLMQQKVSTVAICAGSGASVLKGVKADVYLTGEMSHHEVLDAVSHGTHVILCEHSNTERGFLKVFQDKLRKLLDSQVDVIVSSEDADPLQII